MPVFIRMMQDAVSWEVIRSSPIKMSVLLLVVALLSTLRDLVQTSISAWGSAGVGQPAGHVLQPRARSVHSEHGVFAPPKTKHSASPAVNMRDWALVSATPSRLWTAASVSSPGPAQPSSSLWACLSHHHEWAGGLIWVRAQ